jgi:hypothetical protein
MTCTMGGVRKNIEASVGWWVPDGFSHGWCFHPKQKAPL